MLFRRILITIGALSLVLLVGAWLLLKYAPEVTLKLTQAQLQAQIEPHFPAKKCVLGACIELLAPRLALTNGSNRIVIETTFVATLGHRSMPGSAQLSGRPHYEQASGNFYLTDVQVTQFQMTGAAPDLNEAIKLRGPGIMAAIMNRFPIYSVQSHQEYGRIAKLALKSANIVDGQLQLVLVNPLLIFGKSTQGTLSDEPASQQQNAA
ncbi:DUF1439 domain-containing protein [Undibacterium curvum]|uniref:DUF1439 domain-containing protein n=1 Tax=Undibacterium curvum TaxID=2762294 RepID=A0ABR7A0I8_9BURK|nr:DUF1439 domain-containing protein [Undibacterium curvum]MBC3930434.1 DUF1439 domain-containing protein [Undibacterium curvum]